MRTRIDDVLLLPLDGREAMEGATILVEDGVIRYSGRSEDAPAFQADRAIDGRGRLAMPGLVNAHCHVPMTLLRGVGADRPLQSWLFDCVMPLEDCLTAEDVYWGAMLGIMEMLRFGSTAFLDMYYPENQVARAVDEMGIRATLCRGMTGQGPADQEKLDDGVALYDEYHGKCDGRIQVMLSPHAEYTTTPEFIEMIIKEADRLGCGIHLHLSETASEHRECIERHGKTPARYFADLGAFDRHAVVAHAVHMDEEDARLLAQKGVYVGHCPVSNLKLGSGVMPLHPELLSHTALGTDGVASNNTLNLFEELRLYGILHKGVRQQPTLLPAEQALRAATVNGAKALGFTDVGTLAPGMQADLILLDLDGPHARPMPDVASYVVYAAQGSDVSLTMVRGEVLYEDGDFPRIDMEYTYAKCELAAKMLAERASEAGSSE